MPRAKRYFIPGCVWHITHRCHKKEYLLKFVRDRDRWLELLFKAKQKFGLEVFDYTVTSNHIHLLVADNGQRDTIPRSMHMIAGQTAQAYNQRKKRSGAYWEDRYHATAVESGDHLARCLVYIDTNMVRTGVVSHPSEWRWSGYNEIQNQKQRYTIINYNRLSALLGLHSKASLAALHCKWVENSLKSNPLIRDEKWSQSIAVGSQHYVENIKEKLGVKANHRSVQKNHTDFALREEQAPYNSDLGAESVKLSAENSFFWNVYT